MGATCKPLLLGLGNDILGDDSIGLRIAAAIRERLQGRTDFDVVETTEMGLSLLDFITGHDPVVIVDAVQTGTAPPGSVYELNGDDLGSLPAVSPHFLGIGEVLALGRKLEIPVPSRVKIFAIEVADPFTVTTKLSPELELKLPELIDRVWDQIAQSSLRQP